MRGIRTRQLVLNIQRIIKQCHKIQHLAVPCFIDYANAFDCIRQKKLHEVLREMEVSTNLVDLFRQLYEYSGKNIRL